MSFEDRVSSFNNLVQSSFRNAMNSVESIHQTTAEMPLDILKDFGYPEDKAEAAKDSHRQLLRIVYGGMCSANEELGKLLVLQAGGLSEFFNEMVTGTGSQTPTASKKKAARKASGAARKTTKKKAARKPAATTKKAARKKRATKKSTARKPAKRAKKAAPRKGSG